MNKKLNKQNGITLIALVITIIVMLILVAVTISMAVNGGLFNYAGKATGETQNAINAEQELADGRIKVEGTWYNSIDDYLNDIPSSDQRLEMIKSDESYVGYYADTNNDGEADGIIYADLAKGGTGEWGDQTYTIPTETGFKDYYIVKKDYEDSFGKKDIISTAKETEEETGKERFYVMALTDFSETKVGWTDGAVVGSISGSTAFGSGKSITETIRDRNYLYIDLPDGWFVPCKGEWSAFCDVLNVNYTTFQKYGLKVEYTVSGDWFWITPGGQYWSGARYLSFENNSYFDDALYDSYVRLSRTF